MPSFLTTNISAILKNQRSFNDLPRVERASAEKSIQSKGPSKVSDWGKELNDRLTDNRTLAAGERKSDYEVETQFFEDYFNNGNAAWDANCAEQLLSLGEPLKKAIKVLGFDVNTNPILGFITDNYVIRNLLMPRLLNVNTFKAIYNTVSKKLVADSEFFAANDYNILYCQDLYRRPAAEMIEYLSIQKSILNPSAATYTSADQYRNKKAFFYISSVTELDAVKRIKEIKALPPSTKLPEADKPSTKLNELDIARSLASYRSDVDTAANTNKNSKTGGTGASALVNKLGENTVQAFAAIQYINATTDLPEAKAALKHEAFKNIPISAFIAASTEVKKVMKEAALDAAEAKTFITLLLNRLESA